MAPPHISVPNKVSDVDEDFCEGAPKINIMPVDWIKNFGLDQFVNPIAIALEQYGYRERLRYFVRAHLDLAAARAIAFRLVGDSFWARAFPPFNPPRRPSATAAGFFVPFPFVLCATIAAAIWFMSFGMKPLCLSGQESARLSDLKLSHYQHYARVASPTGRRLQCERCLSWRKSNIFGDNGTRVSATRFSR